jgi:hypothetical protein
VIYNKPSDQTEPIKQREDLYEKFLERILATYLIDCVVK